MKEPHNAVRVLYSFPLRLGTGRINTIAWQQVDGLAAAGADVAAFPASVFRAVRPGVRTRPTLSRGRLRLPSRLLGGMTCVKLHDWIVSRRLSAMASEIDIIHCWSVGALQTLKTAARLGIPTALERCNAHTRFAYEVVAKECRNLGVALPPDHEHAFDAAQLQREEREYRLASGLLCPSDFVVKTFLDQDYPKEKLVRHIYGFDEKVFFPGDRTPSNTSGLTMISVGVCAVRKGLHYALEAWVQSPASRDGTFLIAGEFLPAYRQKLSPLLAHPSVKVLGHRNDVPELVRQSDILILPSIEEGFGLVCTEAMASGCVPLVSEACTDLCRHMDNALVHRVGDIKSIAEHITLLDENRALLRRLRASGLRLAPQITWKAAGLKLLQCYRDILAGAKGRTSRLETAPAATGGLE